MSLNPVGTDSSQIQTPTTTIERSESFSSSSSSSSSSILSELPYHNLYSSSSNSTDSYSFSSSLSSSYTRAYDPELDDETNAGLSNINNLLEQQEKAEELARNFFKQSPAEPQSDTFFLQSNNNNSFNQPLTSNPFSFNGSENFLDLIPQHDPISGGNTSNQTNQTSSSHIEKQTNPKHSHKKHQRHKMPKVFSSIETTQFARAANPESDPILKAFIHSIYPYDLTTESGKNLVTVISGIWNDSTIRPRKHPFFFELKNNDKNIYSILESNALLSHKKYPNVFNNFRKKYMEANNNNTSNQPLTSPFSFNASENFLNLIPQHDPISEGKISNQTSSSREITQFAHPANPKSDPILKAFIHSIYPYDLTTKSGENLVTVISGIWNDSTVRPTKHPFFAELKKNDENIYNILESNDLLSSNKYPRIFRVFREEYRKANPPITSHLEPVVDAFITKIYPHDRTTPTGKWLVAIVNAIWKDNTITPGRDHRFSKIIDENLALFNVLSGHGLHIPHIYKGVIEKFKENYQKNNKSQNEQSSINNSSLSPKK